MVTSHNPPIPKYESTEDPQPFREGGNTPVDGVDTSVSTAQITATNVVSPIKCRRENWRFRGPGSESSPIGSSVKQRLNAASVMPTTTARNPTVIKIPYKPPTKMPTPSHNPGDERDGRPHGE